MDTSADRSTEPTVGRARRVAFFAVLILFSLMHMFLSPIFFVVLGWFAEEAAVSHRIHLIIFGSVFAISLIALLTHVRRPELRIAPMYQVLIVIWLMAGTTLVVDRVFDPFILIFLVMPVVLFLLHPGRNRLLHPRLNRSTALMTLAVAAALPLGFYGVNELRIGLEASQGIGPLAFEAVDNRLPEDASEEQFEAALTEELRKRTSSAEEIELAQHYGHWSAMGAFAVIILGLAFVAALRPPSWPVPAWSAGLAAALYGAASLANPEDASAVNDLWALLAVVWGVAFIAMAERERRALRPAPDSVTDPAPA